MHLPARGHLIGLFFILLAMFVAGVMLPPSAPVHIGHAITRSK
jgi:hypothetical protein